MVMRSRARLWPRGVDQLVLVCLTLGAFANAVPNGFVWIDHWQVESGGLIVRSLPELWQALRAPLGAMPGWEGAAPYARPTVIVTLSLLHAVVGAQAWAYHLALVGMHLANVLLAYGLLRALSARRGVALGASALFAVHPLQTAAVSWISGVADPLFTLCVLLAFRLQLAAASAAASFPWRVVAMLSFAGALGAKETAMVFPLLLLVAALAFPRSVAGSPGTTRVTRAMRTAAPYAALVVANLVYRSLILQGVAFGSAATAVPAWTRWWTLPRLLLSYASLPLRFDALTICDDYALSSGPDLACVAALGLIAGGAVVIIAGFRRWPCVGFGCAWMLLGLLPVLNVVPILHYRADRFFYFPMLGWSVVAVAMAYAGVAALERRGRVAALIPPVSGLSFIAVVLLLVLLTMRRNSLFRDDPTLFEATVAVSPLCREAHTALGDAYLRADRSAAAIAQYELAAAAVPGRASYVVLPKVLINLGMAHLRRSEYLAAEAAFARAHALQPQLLHPLFGLGAANLGLGRVAVAVGWLEQARAVDANDPDIIFNLALGYDRLGRASEALPLYQRYLALAPHGRARALAEERLRAVGGGGP